MLLVTKEQLSALATSATAADIRFVENDSDSYKTIWKGAEENSGHIDVPTILVSK